MVSGRDTQKPWTRLSCTHVEELDVVEDVVVKGKVVGGDDVNTGVLLDLPVGESEALSLGEEVGLRDLVGPVGLVGLLEVPKGSHAAARSNVSKSFPAKPISIALTGSPGRRTEPS